MDEMERIPQIEIVPATANDARGAAEVIYKSWTTTFRDEARGITQEDVEDRMKHLRDEEYLKKMEESYAYPPSNMRRFVAKENGKVIGYCAVIEDETHNRLGGLHVLPDRKWRGIGSKLVNQAKQVLNPQKDTFISVAETNEPAIEFYKKHGFVDTGERAPEEPMKSGAHRTMMKMILRKAVSSS